MARHHLEDRVYIPRHRVQSPSDPTYLLPSPPPEPLIHAASLRTTGSFGKVDKLALKNGLTYIEFSKLHILALPWKIKMSISIFKSGIVWKGS